MAQEPGCKKRRIDAPDTSTAGFAQWNLEVDYARRSRKTKNDDRRQKLPFKTSEGRIVEQAVQPKPEALEVPNSFASDDEADSGIADVQVTPTHQQPRISNAEEIIQAKEELARIAGLISEAPEEQIGLLSSLRDIYDSKNATVKKLALGTQLAVYKDVVPGYRIRPLSKDDMQAKVSKEVKKLRNYEQSLVAGYREFVNALSDLAKGIGSRDVQTGSLASVGITCICGLLTSIPHFNFRNDLIGALVSLMSRRVSSSDPDFARAVQTMEQVFREDEDGHLSLDAVTQLTKMMKTKDYHINERVLDSFLHLRLLNEFSGKASTERVDRASDRADDGQIGAKPKQKREFRTKRERKVLKERKAVEKELKQADAAVSYEERDQFQAETLKMVFVAYFRILKLRVPNLMGAVLEGLARHAHLINQDFFGDLLEVLKDLINEAEESVVDSDDQSEANDKQTKSRNVKRETLLCITTAFALLQGQTDVAKSANALHLDLSFFITRLYRLLFPLCLDPDIELSAKTAHLQDPNGLSTPLIDTKVNVATTTVLLLRSLSSALLPPSNVRSVPPVRVAAFTKQLLTSSLHLPPKSTTALLGLLSQASKVHGSKIAALWDTEERKGDGVFNPLSEEIEAGNPFAATVWESEILKHHFDPKVREGVKSVEHGIRAAGK